MHFNSHTPRGVRPHRATKILCQAQFQLTHPSRGATPKSPSIARLSWISTHTPLAGCDLSFREVFQPYFYFNSHTPRGVRHAQTCPDSRRLHISTHTPLAGCDTLKLVRIAAVYIFQLTHPSRGATYRLHCAMFLLTYISTHTPLAGCDPQ